MHKIFRVFLTTLFILGTSSLHAQEVQKIIPEMVFDTNDIKKLPNGEEIKNVLGLDAREALPILCVAIADLNQEIQRLKVKIKK